MTADSRPRTPSFSAPIDPAQLDAVTEEHLRAVGATKWCRRDGAIGAFIAEADFGTPPAVTEALHAAVDEGMFGYLAPCRHAQLQRATADMVARNYGWKIDPADVHPMGGVVAILRNVIEHFTQADDAIIVPTPCYMPFLTVPAAMGRRVIEVPMLIDDSTGAYVNDLEGIARAFADGGGLLLLCNPHNPTGRVFTRAELEGIAEVVTAAGGRVFADEIWAPLTLDQRLHIPYASLSEDTARHTVTGMAASKGYNIPGLKCAQLITSNQADREHWIAVGHEAMVGAANLGLVGTVAAYDQGDEWRAGIVAYLERNRDTAVQMIEQGLPKARITHPEGTYVLWIDLSGYDLPGVASEFILENAGVACTDGAASGAVGAGHIRFIAAMPHPVMVEALQRIIDAVKEYDAGAIQEV